MKNITLSKKEITVSDVNVTTITKENFEEAFPLTFSTKEQKVLIRLGLVIVAVGILLIVLKDVWETLFLSGLPLILVGLFVTGYGCWLPKRVMKQKYKVLTKLNKNPNLTRRILFYDDYLEVYAGSDAPLTFKYEDIHRCEETEHLYVLFSGKQAIIVDKGGFE